MARQTNAAYWAQRMKNMEDALLDQSYSYVENLEKQFAAAQAEIERQMARWYQRFAANNEIGLAEAKRLLNSKELKEFHWTVGEYIAYGQQNAIDGAWMKQLENASARVHISRLEALKLQLQQQAEVLYSNQLDYVDAAARKMYEGSYYHTAFELQKGLGVGWTMQAINEETITKVLSRPWTTDNQTFRDRCWTNKQSLVNSVNTQLTQMVIRGEAPDRAISAISKQFDVSRAKAGRLVMTESAYFSSAGQKDCYKALDVERYEVVASRDHKVCSFCADMDSKVFKMSDYRVGLTAPPFHPWCRCCTTPYEDDVAELLKRRTSGSNPLPGDMSYKQWKEWQDGLAKAQRAQKIADATPLFEKMQKSGLLRLPPLDEFAEMRYSNFPTYKKLVARFENLTGQRKWAAVEFNPETLADHFKRHGSDLGADAQAYAAAALKFVNGKGAKAVIFDEDGIRRMYSEAENIFASVYPDGTISTFFHPRAGKKYWESQVKKYAKK